MIDKYSTANVALLPLPDNAYECYSIEEEIYILFQNVRVTENGLNTKITIKHGEDIVLAPVHLNLYDHAKRYKLAHDLAGKYQDQCIQWDKLLEYAIEAITNIAHQPPELLNMDADPENLKVDYLLDPVIPLNQPTTLYSQGGKGKSVLADYLSVLITHGVASANGLPFIPRQANVLYLDWESEIEIHRRYVTAIEKGLDLEHSNIYYLACDNAINYYTGHLKNIIKEKEIGFVVIDSQMASTAASSIHGITEAQIASEYYNILRSLGCTTLTIDHVTKQGMTNGESIAPYGSVVKYNRSRSQWELKQSQEPDADTLDMALVHRKFNLGKLHKTIGVRIDFDNQEDALISMRFSSCDIADNPVLSKSLPLWQQIKEVLSRGDKEVSEMAEILGKDAETINTTLYRYKEVFTKTGKSTWGLKARD